MENLPKKVRSKKLSTRVDLTAMVSVSFLLIIFFMVTIELSKPKGIDLGLPDKDPGCGPIGCVDGNRLYTILLDDNDKIVTYSGLLSYPTENPKQVRFGKQGIRTEVFLKKKQIVEYMTAMGKPKSGVIVIIKPSKKSNFKNLVEILDEMNIANIDTFAIVDEFTDEETKLLASN
ncbi:biopolymer transporter ExbD [Flavobacterium sp. ANB]|uniref:ExbD/TolR family protein n=1 Tax=unclassified Flavobacterium TaxID=196869 RepID=UPI0012B6BF61|nr:MULTISPECIES: biopolymer transporter ExbD [unclassified Flavobacterium]MBF4516047.1 biopolymer transporter ExbD [Flavobacterium sp. ANB]MTD69049.1 biopolymer transporter ExbD [Flavobacterium sp. LC2016-13]